MILNRTCHQFYARKKIVAFPLFVQLLISMWQILRCSCSFSGQGSSTSSSQAKVPHPTKVIIYLAGHAFPPFLAYMVPPLTNLFTNMPPTNFRIMILNSLQFTHYLLQFYLKSFIAIAIYKYDFISSSRLQGRCNRVVTTLCLLQYIWVWSSSPAVIVLIMKVSLFSRVLINRFHYIGLTWQLAIWAHCL